MLAIGAEIEGYRIDGVLGRGGMGVVYEATQLSLGRVVALKVLPAELSADDSFRERFRREGRTQASVEHPHIVTVHEAGESDDGFFIAMRLIRGVTLKQLISDGGGLQPERALQLLGQVADALDSAHAAGLIHRDVKPQNVLVDDRDYAYLADFGLALTPELSSVTKSGEFVGTLDYVSPEQVRGQATTGASDIYALAAMAFEALTGDVPFTRESQAALMFAHLSDDPPAASAKASHLGPGVDAALRRGMAKEPADRPASASALIDDVRRALTGGTRPARETVAVPTQAETVAAPRPQVRSRTGLLAAAAAAAVAALVVGGVLLGGGDGGGGDGGGTRTASAEGVVVGSSLPSAGDETHCTGGQERLACTIVQTALPGSDLTAPSDGTITRWSVRGADGRLALAVLRGGRRKQLVALSKVEAASGPRVQTFDTELAVRKGDLIALQVQDGAAFATTGFRPGAKLERFTPPLTLDDSAQGEPTADGLELLVSAEIEP